MNSFKNNTMDEYPLGKAMGAITKGYWGALSKKLEHIGIDRHFTTMVAIDTTKEKCTQQYLSDLLAIDKVAMVRVLDYLFANGMITRDVNPLDRREHIIKHTAKAKRVMPVIHKGINEMNKIAFKGFSKNNQKLFNGFITTIILNLKSLPVNEVDIKIKK